MMLAWPTYVGGTALGPRRLMLMMLAFFGIMKVLRKHPGCGCSCSPVLGDQRGTAQGPGRLMLMMFAWLRYVGGTALGPRRLMLMMLALLWNHEGTAQVPGPLMLMLTCFG